MIEIDITSYTDAADYCPYQVPEVWLFKVGQLRLFTLTDGGYQLANASRYFPGVNLADLVADTLQVAAVQGSGAAIQTLRQRLG